MRTRLRTRNRGYTNCCSSKDDEVDGLREELKAAQAASETAKQALVQEKSRADRAVEEAGKARQAAEEEAANARKDAREEVAQARKDADAAQASLDADNSNKRLLEAELKGQSGLSEFVRQSLSDILAGVDHAAVEARSRQMEGGLKESGFTTPGRVGFPSGSGRDSMVDFDLAVVAGTQTKTGDTDKEETEAGARIDFMKVIALPFSVEARRRVQRERSSEESREQTHHNRIRFSVPVTFASLDDPTE